MMTSSPSVVLNDGVAELWKKTNGRWGGEEREEKNKNKREKEREERNEMKKKKKKKGCQSNQQSTLTIYPNNLP